MKGDSRPAVIKVRPLSRPVKKCAHIHTHTHARTHTHMHTGTHTCIYGGDTGQTHTHARTHTHMHTGAHTCIYGGDTGHTHTHAGKPEIAVNLVSAFSHPGLSF